MKILISGSTGLVGTELVHRLSERDHTVVRLVRRAATSEHEIEWDPAGGRLDPGAVSGFDAVVHLAGENVAGRRWSAKQKEAIRSSRVDGTRLLAEALATTESPPRSLVCASAIGFYGSRGDEELTEDSSPGDEFLSDVCRAWEEAARPAIDRGIRTAFLRYGVILSDRGGALAKMLTPFKLGVAGKMGHGRQWMSWLSLDDAAGIILHALETESLEGPINAVSPSPVTNLQFTKALGAELRRPTVFPMPAFAARLAFGEMADALLLGSTRVIPNQLLRSDYKFRHRELQSALHDILQSKQ